MGKWGENGIFGNKKGERISGMGWDRCEVVVCLK